jgi:hypothetical protein
MVATLKKFVWLVATVSYVVTLPQCGILPAAKKARVLKEPLPGPRPGDQVNLTDEESRIMPVSGGGYEQCYNSQAAVATGTLLVLATTVTQATNDKQQIVPMLEALSQLPECLGPVDAMLADTGYHSTTNVDACNEKGITPVIAATREHHHPDAMARFTEPSPLPDDAKRLRALNLRSALPGRCQTNLTR